MNATQRFWRAVASGGMVSRRAAPLIVTVVFAIVVAGVAVAAAEGGTIALVEDGDHITIDIPNRSIVLDVAAAEIDRRRAAMLARGASAWIPAAARARRVSVALQAYAALTTSAARGAVKDISQLTKRAP